MNKSIEFCKTASLDANRSNFTDRDWTDENRVYVVAAKDLFDKYIYGNRKLRVDGTDEHGNKVSFNVDINFSQNADFQYFASESCIYDGTMLFLLEMFEKLVTKVCTCETYYKQLDAPKSGDTIHYTMGDFVILNEYSNNFVQEKPWLCERTTVMLPIYMEIDRVIE